MIRVFQRADLENTIIGTVLLFRNAFEYVSFLRPGNFESPNDKVWEIICKKAPLNADIYDLAGIGYEYYEYLSKAIAVPELLPSKALLLIEVGITQKILSGTDKMIENSYRKHDLRTRGVCMEIKDSLLVKSVDPHFDVLKFIDDIIVFCELKKCEYPKKYFEGLNELIDKRAEEIKSKHRIYDLEQALETAKQAYNERVKIEHSQGDSQRSG